MPYFKHIFKKDKNPPLTAFPPCFYSFGSRTPPLLLLLSILSSNSFFPFPFFQKSKDLVFLLLPPFLNSMMIIRMSAKKSSRDNCRSYGANKQKSWNCAESYNFLSSLWTLFFELFIFFLPSRPTSQLNSKLIKRLSSMSFSSTVESENWIIMENVVAAQQILSSTSNS